MGAVPVELDLVNPIIALRRLADAVANEIQGRPCRRNGKLEVWPRQGATAASAVLMDGVSGGSSGVARLTHRPSLLHRVNSGRNGSGTNRTVFLHQVLPNWHFASEPENGHFISFLFSSLQEANGYRPWRFRAAMSHPVAVSFRQATLALHVRDRLFDGGAVVAMLSDQPPRQFRVEPVALGEIGRLGC